jgi:hypothetical protein
VIVECVRTLTVSAAKDNRMTKPPNRIAKRVPAAVFLNALIPPS